MDANISRANKRAITNTSRYRLINLIKTQKQWAITIVNNLYKLGKYCCSQNEGQIVPKLDLQKALKHNGHPKKRRKGNVCLLITGSGISCSIVDFGGILGSISLNNWRLSNLVSSHFFINLLQIELFQIHSREVLYEIPPQKLKPLEVPAEKYSIVLLGLLEALDGLGCKSFGPLPGSSELLIFLLG